LAPRRIKMDNNIRKYAEELHGKCTIVDAHLDLLMDVELALTLEILGNESSSEIDRVSCKYMKEIVEEFYNDEDGRIIEAIGPKGIMSNNILCRHFNPVHTIEDVWFVMNLTKSFTKYRDCMYCYYWTKCSPSQNIFL